MGCDIHGVIEVRDGDRWVCVTPLRKRRIVRGMWEAMEVREPRQDDWLGRNYAAFAVLAGVRAQDDSPPPIAEPRGVPADASEDAKTLVRSLSGDGHSHSWVTMQEVFARAEVDGECLHNFREALADVARDCHAEPADVRLVFFFDN